MPPNRRQRNAGPAPEHLREDTAPSCRPTLLGDSRGITLLEILISFGIIGIIVSIGAQLYLGALERARVTRASADIRTIEKLIDPRAIDGIDLPATLDELGWGSLDPWGRPYVFMNFEIVAEEDKDENDNTPNDARRDKFLKPLNTRYDVYSTGKDGESEPNLNEQQSWDDVLRGADGVYVGLASEF